MTDLLIVRRPLAALVPDSFARAANAGILLMVFNSALRNSR